ncbi:ABC transporter permease (plasmid) [Rhizobium leguminosarum]|uniref:Nitrate transport permease nrtB n=4 Tax=Rhizobium TaxID=379 RepID=A0A1B8R5H6_RHILT|nr:MULTISPECIES: ABC transporter permease [Rhizobium]MDH6662593.1 NitT/TauT family transport system permease protein [Rhizobium sophorae]AOO93155.1 nitrate transport permease nrtB [Rhizobium leguminosarum bv. trifolii]ASS58232.1 ABC transporter permease [Rhizobium leguminosarum bv. viciae]MBB4332683.1 NitT/TauT family transport system permease protein [Rhizobium leguminosarum]MBB4345881.1 NitT/TauT family transport system permease protein [Rhizobium leguminosarum]
MSSSELSSTTKERSRAPSRAGVGRPPGAFRIGDPISGRSFFLIAVAVFALLFAVWWVATITGWVKPIFLPSPGAVWAKMMELAVDGTLWTDAGISIYRMLVGFLIASALAIPIGIMIGCFKTWEAAIEPFVDFVRYMPVVAFVPLTILWAGTSDIQKFVIIFIGTFFQQVLMVMDSVKRVPTDFVGLGRTLGMSETRILRRIVLPSALPGIWDTLRISLGWAWTWLVLAELVAATSGLGYRIVVSQRYFQTQTIIGYILLLGLLGLITDQSMKALERIFFRYAARH